MSRRSEDPSLNAELHSLEQELAALTLRVAALRRARANPHPTRTQRPPISTPHIGDRVRFLIAGAHAEGVIIGVTTHRVHIRQNITNHVVLRAPRNVTILP
jgi:hypothetical protein